MTDPIDAEASQQPTAEDKQVAATSTDRGKVTLLTAASKHSAVKSKAAKPLTVLQCIAENIESTPESGKEDASQQSVLCGHTGLASLAETPVSTGIKEDPHSPDENPGQEDTHKSVNTVEIALGDEGDQRWAYGTIGAESNCKSCTGFKNSQCQEGQPRIRRAQQCRASRLSQQLQMQHRRHKRRNPLR